MFIIVALCCLAWLGQALKDGANLSDTPPTMSEAKEKDRIIHLINNNNNNNR